MTVVTAIKTGLQVAKTLRRYGEKYRYIDPTQKFIQKFVPPPYRRPARIITDAAIGGGIIYDVISFLEQEYGQKPVRPYTAKQTRNSFQQPSAKRGYSSEYYTNRRSSNRRREFCYRGPNRPYGKRRLY